MTIVSSRFDDSLNRIAKILEKATQTLLEWVKEWLTLLLVFGLACQVLLPFVARYFDWEWDVLYPLVRKGGISSAWCEHDNAITLGWELSGYIPWFKLAALVGNVFFALVFFVHIVRWRTCFSTLGFAMAVVLLFCAGMAFVGGVLTLNQSMLEVHLAIIVFAAFCYASLDLCLAVSIMRDPPLQAPSRREFFEYLLFLDVPNIISFVLIVIMLFDRQALIHGDMDVRGGTYFFVSGVIAFQWLASNLLFVILALRHPDDWFGIRVRKAGNVLVVLTRAVLGVGPAHIVVETLSGSSAKAGSGSPESPH